MKSAPTSIAETIVHGVAFDPKNSYRAKDKDLNKLFASVGNLFNLLEDREVSYVLVGGVAMLAYVEGRNTQVIDLILAEDDLKKLPEVTLEDRNAEFARGKFGSLQVDLLFTSNRLFSQVASEHSTVQRFAEHDVRCATERGLMLLKLFALPSLYRQGQFDKVRIYEGDIASLLDKAPVEADALLGSLEPLLAASDVEELRNILRDIRRRLDAAKQRFREE